MESVKGSIVEITRQQNRKLYLKKRDGEKERYARYTNASDLMDFIKRGAWLRIVNKQDGKEVTNQILFRMFCDRQNKSIEEETESISNERFREIMRDLAVNYDGSILKMLAHLKYERVNDSMMNSFNRSATERKEEGLVRI